MNRRPLRRRPDALFLLAVGVALGVALTATARAAEPPGLHWSWAELKDRILPPPPSLRLVEPPADEESLSFSVTFARPQAELSGRGSGVDPYFGREVVRRWSRDASLFLGVQRRF